MNQQNIPQKFLCPLTKRLMEDPVIISDGITYERGAIAEWLVKSLNSPVTNQPLHPQENLVPNYQLKKQIQAWISTNPQPNQSQNYPPPPPPYYPPSNNPPMYNQPPPAFGQPNPYGQPPYGQNPGQPTQIVLQTKTVQQLQNQQAAEDACCAALTCLAVLECLCIILRCLR